MCCLEVAKDQITEGAPDSDLFLRVTQDNIPEMVHADFESIYVARDERAKHTIYFDLQFEAGKWFELQVFASPYDKIWFFWTKKAATN